MPRNMSFALTTSQVRNRTKTVTRRLGWWKDKNGRRLIQPGDIVQACEKVQGIKRGELVRICQIRIVDVRRERLDCMMLHNYAMRECELEGFPDMLGPEFVTMFCKEMGCQPDTEITRIEFEYVEANQ